MASKNRPAIKPVAKPILRKKSSVLTSKTYSCANCGVECKKRLQKSNKFCTNACQKDYDYFHFINDWIKGRISGIKADGVLSGHIKRHLRASTDNKCSECGWSKPNPVNGIVPLEIDHIDGDRNNNRPSNLRILCPNCHSLTPTYRVLNKRK